MRCEKCGTEMNHHAEKLVEPSGTADAAVVDPVLGGVLEEVHGCPGCGHVQSHRA